MPRVTPHYGSFISFPFIQTEIFFFLAVKCNDDTNVIKLLAYLGAGFDCASKVNHFSEDKIFPNISFSG
jgi:hypothetical protein